MCVALQDEAHHGQRHRGLRRIASGLHQDTSHLGTGEIRCHVFRVLTSSPTGFGGVLFIIEWNNSGSLLMLSIANVFLC